jgi:tRNA G18 (ribose-2'-O)-methylase SpoU
MPIVHLETLDDPRVGGYHALLDHDRQRTGNQFLAEGRLVLERLVETGRYRLCSVLVSETAFRALEATLGHVDDRVPIFVSRTGSFRNLAGLNIHRGCLALAERPDPMELEALAAAARCLVLLDRVANPDNVGGIFRNVAAFGADGIVLNRSADPLYRKSIRTSMAATLAVPFVRVDAWTDAARVLRAGGFTIAALEPRGGLPIGRYAMAARPERLALLLGAEGDGLGADALAMADVRLRIPIARGVDSLNVAVASGIALAALTAVT